LLPFVKRSVSKIIDQKNFEIKEKLSEISGHLDAQLKVAGLGHIKSEFKYPNDSLELLLGSFELHLSDPASTPIDRKGMGIQAASILASFLWITKEEKASGKNTIWLIEEPESYLHPQLTESCLRMLDEIAKESLLVSTTHSLGFVDKNPTKILGTEIVESETKTKNYSNYLDATNSIRRALGVKFSDFYNLGLLNIFVEGKTDREIFSWALEKIPVDSEKTVWRYVRAAEFLDFTGVSGLEGFMKATYEFIQKERPVVVVMDGDDAGQKALKNLQQYFGNKGIGFEANKDFISLHKGFALEGLFPHKWINQAHEEHPNWFVTFTPDVTGELQSFDTKSEGTKEQLRKYLVNLAEADEANIWTEKFVQLFDVLDKELEKKFRKLYGHDL
jgi:predicted ATP-dependent endonuclease of OLD family